MTYCQLIVEGFEDNSLTTANISSSVNTTPRRHLDREPLLYRITHIIRDGSCSSTSIRKLSKKKKKISSKEVNKTTAISVHQMFMVVGQSL